MIDNSVKHLYGILLICPSLYTWMISDEQLYGCPSEVYWSLIISVCMSEWTIEQLFYNSTTRESLTIFSKSNRYARANTIKRSLEREKSSMMTTISLGRSPTVKNGTKRRIKYHLSTVIHHRIFRLIVSDRRFQRVHAGLLATWN